MAERYLYIRKQMQVPSCRPIAIKSIWKDQQEDHEEEYNPYTIDSFFDSDNEDAMDLPLRG